MADRRVIPPLKGQGLEGHRPLEHTRDEADLAHGNAKDQGTGSREATHATMQSNASRKTAADVGWKHDSFPTLTPP